MRSQPRQVSIRPALGFGSALALCLLACLVCAPHVQGGEIRTTRIPPSSGKGVDSYTITERGDRHRVSISYPHIGQAVADAEMAIWARDQALTFSASITMLPTPPPVPYELTIQYETVTSPKVISVVFFITTSTGGSQPQRGMATFVYDRKSGRRLSYANLFLNREGLLETLSDICRESLAQQLGPKTLSDMLTAGTAPELVNFDLFSLTPEGLRIFFPPYQVAPYSEGYLSVSVPLAKLRSFKPQNMFWDIE